MRNVCCKVKHGKCEWMIEFLRWDKNDWVEVICKWNKSQVTPPYCYCCYLPYPKKYIVGCSLVHCWLLLLLLLKYHNGALTVWIINKPMLSMPENQYNLRQIQNFDARFYLAWFDFILLQIFNRFGRAWLNCTGAASSLCCAMWRYHVMSFV